MVDKDNDALGDAHLVIRGDFFLNLGDIAVRTVIR